MVLGETSTKVPLRPAGDAGTFAVHRCGAVDHLIHLGRGWAQEMRRKRIKTMKDRITFRAWRVALALGSLTVLAVVAEAGRRWG